MRKRKLLIVDVEEPPKPPLPSAFESERAKLSLLQGEARLDYGKNLDTVAKAYAWLTDSRNWFDGQTFIVKWDCYLPTVCSNHGSQLLMNPSDDGLARVVVVRQRELKTRPRPEEEEDVQSGTEA